MVFPALLALAASLVWKSILGYGSLIFILSVPAVYQEWKIWAASPTIPSLSVLGCVKVYLFNVIWMTSTYVGALLLVPKWVLGGFGGAVELEANTLVERITAFICVSLFVGPVVVRGGENLPPDSGWGIDEDGNGRAAPVYIANHSSQIDVGAVYYLMRRWKWVAKESVLFLPGVGQCMFLGRHVFIRRSGKNKSSIKVLYEKSNTAVRSGIAMFLFPQGTRRMAQRLPFKDGAFNIACENGCLVVPVSVEIPPGAFNGWYPLSLLWGAKQAPVVMTIHEPIEDTKGADKEGLKKRCYDTIYSVLPNYEEEKEGEKKTESLGSEKMEDKKER